MVPRLKKRYDEEILPRLLEERGYGNPMAVPRLVKISVNMGVGSAAQDIKELDAAMEGCSVTLRGARMYEFLDRLITITLPRVRDFRGVPRRSFDGRGNYTLGLRDQLIFPEIDYTRVDKVRGMNVTICTSAETDDDARALLDALGMPFRRDR